MMYLIKIRVFKITLPLIKYLGTNLKKEFRFFQNMYFSDKFKNLHRDIFINRKRHKSEDISE